MLSETACVVRESWKKPEHKQHAPGMRYRINAPRLFAALTTRGLRYCASSAAVFTSSMEHSFMANLTGRTVLEHRPGRFQVDVTEDGRVLECRSYAPVTLVFLSLRGRNLATGNCRTAEPSRAILRRAM